MTLRNAFDEVATETTLNDILGQLDITLSVLRDALVPQTDALTDQELRASPVAVDTRPRVPATPLTAVVTATSAGTTTLIPAPGVGQRVVVHYLYFTPRGDETAPLVNVRFGTSQAPLFRGYAAGKTWRWEGAENEAVEAVLDAAGSVAFTLLYETEGV